MFSGIPEEEKVKILEKAKSEIEAELYKNLARLGHDPDTYNTSNWNFNPSSTTPEVEPDYHTKAAITSAKSRITALNAKLAQLSN